jgi:hypothetical protein
MTITENRRVRGVAGALMNERRQIPHIRVLTVCLSALGMAACGSGTAGSSQPAVGAAFASKAVAVCHAAYALKKAVPFPYPDFNPSQPDTTKFSGIARYEAAHTVPAYRAWLREMQALGQPPTGQAAWADLLTAIDGHVRNASEQQAAAQRGDTQTFINDYQAGSTIQADLLSAADAAGVPECAAVDR